MTTAATDRVPVEFYLRSADVEREPDAEYVDGVIEERPMGEYDHATWQAAVYDYFRQHQKEWNIRVRPELRIQVAPTRFRVPDVTVIDRSLPIEQVITHPPLAVFEILSPEDIMTRMMIKLGDYQGMGIMGIFVIDPANDKCWRFGENGLREMSDEERVGDRFTVKLAEIRQNLD